MNTIQQENTEIKENGSQENVTITEGYGWYTQEPSVTIIETQVKESIRELNNWKAEMSSVNIEHGKQN